MKIGVYICHCGINISATVDVEELKKFAETITNVKVSRNYQYMCSDPGQDLIKNDIKEIGLDRIVVAACSPRMHELTFRKVLRSSGINPYFLEIANIREQCSWVHQDKQQATEKAKELISSAVAKVLLHEPLEENEVCVTPTVMIIGGGIAGIQSALDVANSGFKVYLIEKTPTIGGHITKWDYIFPNLDETVNIINPKMKKLEKHPLINLLTNSEVQDIEGFIGNFRVKVKHNPRFVNPEKCNCCKKCEDVCPVKVPDEFNMGLKRRSAIYLPNPFSIPFSYIIDPLNCLFLQRGECGKCRDICPEGAIQFEEFGLDMWLEVGTIIVATGFEPFDPRIKPEFGYERYSNVITSLELERLLSKTGPTNGDILIDGKIPKNILFIQCVGSRDKTVGNEYCSRVCCMYTAKQAYLLKEKIPEAKITICYIDVRAFGKGYEQFYEQVQKKGIIYRKGIPSEVYQKEGGLVIKAEDELLGEVYEEKFDLIVLAIGLTQRSDAERLKSILKISQGTDRFFLEIHPKLRPLDTAVDGIFLAGTCQGPKDICDTISQAHGAASKALTPLFTGKVRIEPITAIVDELICTGCGLCEQVCEYNALKMDTYRKIMTVNEALCKGCGACNATCPSCAISLKHFKTEQIMAQIRELC